MNVKSLLDGLKERLAGLSKAQRVAALLVALGTLASIVMLVSLLTKTTYAPLFTGIESRQAGAVVEQLKSSKIPYRLADNGSTIEVPQELVYETRIKMASDGLLAGGGPGFELFDQNKFGVTDFEQQVSYQRALQEELRRTIVQLEGVEQARVHLVLPRESVFVNERQNATASVALQLSPAARLQKEQVMGIRDLLVGSVKGLGPENVTIIDNQGNVLSNSLADGDDEMAGSQQALKRLEVKQAYERQLEDRIKQILVRVMGPNKVAVMADAEIDYSQREAINTSVGQGALLNEQDISEENSAGALGGLAGTPSNVPDTSTYEISQGESSGTYRRTETTRNYQVPNSKETLIQPPGGLSRLSVAVLVDEENFNLNRQSQLEAIVKASVGYSEVRGDTVTVTAMPFDTTYKDIFPEEGASAQGPAASGYLMYFIIGGVLLVLLLLGIILARRSKKKTAARVQEAKRMALLKQEEEANRVLNENRQLADMPKRRIKELAEKRPDEISEIIKIWISE